jgi:3-oxocholest-4-en-26-oyl-CoA dehydrogenase alpha subunit
VRTPDSSGTALINDPSIRESLAEVAVGVELARSTLGPMDRIITSDLLMRKASDLLDLVGPTGLLEYGTEGANGGGVPEAGFRFAPGTAIYGGSTDIARNVIAERHLGLPRSTPQRSKQ